MIAAACAARRSPSALNGVSGAVSPCATASSSSAMRAMTSAQSSPLASGGTAAWSGTRDCPRGRASSASRSPTAAAPRPACRARRRDARPTVSTVITRSSALTAAAVSAKSLELRRKIVDRHVAFALCFSFLRSAARGPNCRLANDAPAHGEQRRKRARSSERRLSLTCSGLPAHTKPTLRPAILASRVFPALRRLRRRAQIGHVGGNGFEPRLEQARQAQQHRVALIGRRIAAVAEHGDAGQALAQQPHELLMHAQRHACRRARRAAECSARTAAYRQIPARPARRCACRRGFRPARAFRESAGPCARSSAAAIRIRPSPRRDRRASATGCRARNGHWHDAARARWRGATPRCLRRSCRCGAASCRDWPRRRR